jgi:VWFA-related protein
MTASRLLQLSLVVSLAVTLHAQQPPADPHPQATFKTGIDVVQLDVSVFDKDHRPIHGLTKDDFTVLENGKPQTIVALVPVDVADPEPVSAAWLRDAPLDTVSNAREARRLIMILLDDAGIGVEFGEPKSLRDIAHRIVDGMGPEDLASVVFTYVGKPQNWTADRASLRAAIESFSPKKITTGLYAGRGIAPAGALPASAGRSMKGLDGLVVCKNRRGDSCLVDTLLNVGTALQEAPPGRKLVMLISSDGALNVKTNPDGLSPITDAFKALQRANATVYGFDPRGLTTSPTGEELDDLRSIAGATGGRVFANTNAPEDKVPDVFRENASYYLIGFRSTDAARDGTFRRIEIKVNRADASVRTRLGYYAPRGDARASATPRPPTTTVDAALTSLIPANDVPITLSVAAFALPGQRTATLTIVAGLDQAGATGAPQRVNVVASVFDTDGKSQATHRQTLELTSEADQFSYDVYARIPEIKPGHYEVRFAAERAGRAGSVFASVEVPEFSKEDLALSGVLIERTPSRTIANPDELTKIVDVEPTAARHFAPDDRVRAFLRIYQKEPRPVHVVAKVLTDRNDSVFEHTEELAATTFQHGSADYRIDVPLAQGASALPAGQYLLTIEVSAANKRLTRDVRFSVR